MSGMRSNRATYIVLIFAVLAVVFATKQFFRLRDIVYNEALQQALASK